MTEENILQGNKMIFDFMQCIHSESEEIDRWEMEALKYHSDWNWIIPVYKKIVAIAKPIHEKEAKVFKGSGVTWTSECGELTWEVYNSCRDFEIEKVFPAIIKWIKWYNSEQKLKVHEISNQ